MDSRPGAFGEGMVDYKTPAPDQVEVAFGRDLKIKFVIVEDSKYERLYEKSGKKTNASHQTNAHRENKQLTWRDMFGGTPTVRVRQSVLESDRGMTAVFAHEYLEIAGLYQRSASELIHSRVEGPIDTLHNRAVRLADDLVCQMMAGKR